MTPGQLVHRSRNGEREAHTDRKMLWWIGRFRYTSVELLALRFGVAPQNIRIRLKRLHAGGLVRLERRSVTEPWVVSLTSAGSQAIGEPPRKRPRAELHQAHELAIGWVCARMESDSRYAHLAVLTEREMRQRDRRRRSVGLAPRHHVELLGAPRGQSSRWPDLVVEDQGGPVRALELEFTQKADDRLTAIIEAYRTGPFPEVVYVTADPNLAGKLARVIRDRRYVPLHDEPEATIRVVPWPRLGAGMRALIMTRAQASSDASMFGDELDL